VTAQATRLLPLFILLALMISSPVLAEETSPSNVVEKLHGVFIDSMKNAETLGYQGRFEMLNPAIDVAYNLPFMAQKVLGSHWKKLTPEEQELWRGRFADYTVANYAGRFVGYTGESFETLGEQPWARDTMMVQTKLLLTSGDTKAVEFNYRLAMKDEGWRIIDVYMNGTVSELALRRSDFSSLLKREGFDKLVLTIGEKIAELEDRSDDKLAAELLR
jgi:phospholipid transport system substrate-binding protein